MKLICKSSKLAFLIFILTLNNMTALSGKITLGKYQRLKYRRKSKVKSATKVTSAKTNFQNFVVGFKTAFENSLFDSCLRELFPDVGNDGEINADLDIQKYSKEDMYNNLKNTVINIADRIFTKVADSTKCPAQDKSSFSSDSVNSTQFEKISNDLSPHRGWPDQFPKKNTDKSKRPSGLELFNYTERLLGEAIRLCSPNGTTTKYFDNQKIQLAALKIQRGEYSTVETDENSWLDKIKKKFSDWFKAIKKIISSFVDKLKNFVKCEIDKFKTANERENTKNAISLSLDIADFVLGNLPIIGTVVKILRFVFTFYDFILIGRMYYDSYNEEDVEKKYKGYGSATFYLLKSLIYVFTGFKYGSPLPNPQTMLQTQVGNARNLGK